MTGTDLAGLISVTTGTTLAATAPIVTLTFARAYSSAPYCVVSANTSGTSGYSFYVTTTTTTMVLNIASVALSGSTLYKWMYHCSQ